MEERSTVAVLISTYNGEPYLEEQLRSILRQDLAHPAQIWIRDDGSSDGTAAILQAFEKQYETVHVLYGDNIGITASYFELIRTVPEFDYYALCDQDDKWLPDKLTAALRVLQKREKELEQTGRTKVPLLYGCRSYLTDGSLKKTGHLTQKKRRELVFYNTAVQNILLGHNQVMNGALFALLREEKVQCEKIYAHDMWITNLAAVKGEILFENAPHTLYRQHARNELGFGTGPVSWLIMRMKRAAGGESRKVAVQTDYFRTVHAADLSSMEKREIDRFFSCNKNLLTRLWYAATTKLYRQKRLESILLRILYCMGGYRL